MVELLPPYCSLKKLSFILDTCDGFSMRTSTRDLHGNSADGNSTDGNSVDGDSADGPKNKTTVPAPEQASASDGFTNTTTVPASEEANASTNNSFQATSCSRSCIRSNNRVCFNTAVTSHETTFFAVDSSGQKVGRTYKKTIAVGTNTNSCRTANVQCVN
jgi:hypothetical protein